MRLKKKNNCKYIMCKQSGREGKKIPFNDLHTRSESASALYQGLHSYSHDEIPIISYSVITPYMFMLKDITGAVPRTAGILLFEKRSLLEHHFNFYIKI